MDVLNLVTTPRPFFELQCQALEDRGIEPKIIKVPGRETTQGQRTVTDYIRFYPKVIRGSLSDPDIVHGNFGLTAPFALAQPCRPVVLSLWGTDLMGEYSPVVKRCTRHFDEVIVMSEAMAEMVDTDVTVIPHGVNFEKFRPIDQGRAQDLVGWSQQKRHILFPYHPSRDVKDYPKAKRVVDEVNEALAEEVDLKVVHDVEHDDLYKYMNASDALLLTSKREGSPNSVKEALACNLPVVSTDVGGVSNHLSDVSNSYVGATEQELVEHLSSVIKSDQRSDGRNHAANLSLDQMAEDIVSVYKRALS